MSAGVSTGLGKKGEQSQDFELNLASIIDCFTVLITFMLASTSFLAIGLLDAGVAAAGAAPTENVTPPPVNVTVELSKTEVMTIKVTGKANQTLTVPAKDAKLDLEGLTGQLAALKSKWSGLTAVTVSAENTVQYKDVVQTMEAARKTLPVVLLGGF